MHITEACTSDAFIIKCMHVHVYRYAKEKQEHVLLCTNMCYCVIVPLINSYIYTCTSLIMLTMIVPYNTTLQTHLVLYIHTLIYEPCIKLYEGLCYKLSLGSTRPPTHN